MVPSAPRGVTAMGRANLQAARKAAGLTQKDVAAYLGISVTAYQYIEHGKTVGRVEHWDKLEDLFGIHQRKLREIIQSAPQGSQD